MFIVSHCTIVHRVVTITSQCFQVGLVHVAMHKSICESWVLRTRTKLQQLSNIVSNARINCRPSPGEPGTSGDLAGDVKMARHDSPCHAPLLPGQAGHLFFVHPWLYTCPVMQGILSHLQHDPSGKFITNPARSRPRHAGHLLQTLHDPGPDMRLIFTNLALSRP